MPNYLYECEKCGATQNIIHSIKEDLDVKCECGSPCFRVLCPPEINVRGSCYMNKKDCKTQAAISTLKDADPYQTHRLPGETDDIINKLKRGDRKKVSAQVNGLKKKK